MCFVCVCVYLSICACVYVVCACMCTCLVKHIHIYASRCYMCASECECVSVRACTCMYVCSCMAMRCEYARVLCAYACVCVSLCFFQFPSSHPSSPTDCATVPRLAALTNLSTARDRVPRDRLEGTISRLLSSALFFHFRQLPRRVVRRPCATTVRSSVGWLRQSV